MTGVRASLKIQTHNRQSELKPEFTAVGVDPATQEVWAAVGNLLFHFDKDGNPTPTLLAAQKDRLENWHMLQDLAGIN